MTFSIDKSKEWRVNVVQMDVKKVIGSNREQNTCFNVLLKCVWVVNENDAKFILTSVLNKAATNDIDE